MGRIDYHQARQVLTSGLNLAKGAFAQAIPPTTDSSLIPCFDAIFASRTQAYREVLLGCLLARIVDREIDIRLPYLSQGPRAFPGRDLDEKVVNPLLRANQIPCSKGPYLNVFRRQVKFDEATREGLRDKPGYDAFLCLLDRIEAEQSEERLREMLVYCFTVSSCYRKSDRQSDQPKSIA